MRFWHKGIFMVPRIQVQRTNDKIKKRILYLRHAQMTPNVVNCRRECVRLCAGQLSAQCDAH